MQIDETKYRSIIIPVILGFMTAGGVSLAIWQYVQHKMPQPGENSLALERKVEPAKTEQGVTPSQERVQTTGGQNLPRKSAQQTPTTSREQSIAARVAAAKARVAAAQRDKEKVTDQGFVRIGQQIQISEARRKSLLGPEMQELQKQVRAKPYLNAAGKVDGFQIIRLNQNSILYKAGLRSQDVIRQVNQTRLTDVSAVLLAMQQAQQQQNFSIKILRDSREIVYRIAVAASL